MSIQEHITQLTDARNVIRNWLLDLGLCTSTDKLEALAAKIAAITNHGAVNVQILEGSSYTIPAGYHNGTGVVLAMTDTAGEEQKYLLQPVITVTPTKAQQSISSGEGYYGLAGVTVAAIPEAYQDITHTTADEASVLANKIFVKADGTTGTGTMPNNGAATKALDTSSTSYTIPKGYHNGNGKVSITTETKAATPTKEKQTVTPASGKVLSSVTVNAIPEAYQDITHTTADEASVLDDKVFVKADGTTGTGAMPNNGEISAALGLTAESYTIPEGYTSGGEVALDASIEEALAAI